MIKDLREHVVAISESVYIYKVNRNKVETNIKAMSV